MVRFADFEVDLQSSELRRRGVRIKLPEQAFQVLSMLVERPGGLVTREELRQRLWKDDTFVDFDTGLNSTVKRLRDALGDSADNPRFVETLPRRGYRFIAAVEWDGGAVGTHAAVPEVTPPATPEAGVRRFRIVPLALTGAALTTVVAVIVALNPGGWRDRLLNRGNPPRIESIAVLPLENLSRDPEQEYFADGMTEALITELGKISALRVISRQSVMQYKDSQKPLTQIAQELKVDAVVEGAVMREGNRVSVTAQLIQARPERHLWAERYERDLTSILVLQSEVARDIAREIKTQLTPQEQVRLASARSASPEAYDAYLRGVYYHNKFANEQQEEPLRKSIEYFEQAIRLDPGLAPAFAHLSKAYGTLADDFHFPEFHSRAKAAAMKALELDDGLAEAHTALAFIKVNHDWDWAGAERESKRAIELNPSYAWGHYPYASCLILAGRYEEALAQFKRAEGLDPLVLPHKGNIGWTYACARQYDQAVEQYRSVLALNQSAWLHGQLGATYGYKGMYKEGLGEMQKAVELSGGAPRSKAGLAWAYAMAGKTDEALKIVSELKQPPVRKGVTALDLASIYAALGEKDQALAWLEKAYEERNRGLPFIKCSPEFDKLREDPRFRALLRRMNLPE